MRRKNIVLLFITLFSISMVASCQKGPVSESKRKKMLQKKKKKNPADCPRIDC